MSDQPEIPIEYKINQLLHRSVPMPTRHLTDAEEAHKELLERVKADPEWKSALMKVCVSTVQQVLLGRGRDISCLRDRQREVNFMLDLALEAHPPLRNGIRLPIDPAHTPERPG